MPDGAAQYIDQVMFWIPGEVLFDFPWVGLLQFPTAFKH